MNEGKIRSFIAVALSEPIVKKIEDLQDKLKETKADVKWVKPDNIHLTLKFLGHISEKEIPKINISLQKIGEAFIPFSVFIEGVGFFPNAESPRVIWLGISKGSELLKEINKKIENDLSKIGFPREERIFNPHLTLGRCRSAKHKDRLSKMVKKGDFFIGELKVEKLSLYKSILTPLGPVYTLLNDTRLGG